MNEMTTFAAKPTQLLGRVPRRAWRWAFRLVAVALIVPALLQWIIAYIVGNDARILPPQLLAAKSLLIVTAHPDDECLFFSPSILGVLDRNKAITGSLLVMSTGELRWLLQILQCFSMLADSGAQATIMDLVKQESRSFRGLARLWAFIPRDASPWTILSCKTTPESGGIPISSKALCVIT
jgi:hypothetical protein